MKFGIPVAPTHYRNLVQLIRDLSQQLGIPELPHIRESLTKIRNHESAIQGSVSARPVLEQVLPQNGRNGGELNMLTASSTPTASGAPT